jgi:predicted nucleic acid-binding protein
MPARSRGGAAKTFLDTNVIIYAFDPAAPAKQARAADIIRGRGWVVSWQVIQEFANVALHRFEVPLGAEDLSDYLEWVLWPRCLVFPSPEIHRKAIAIHDELGFRFYDSLIVASALCAGMEVLFSEDLQHGQLIGPLRVENPFL